MKGDGPCAWPSRLLGSSSTSSGKFIWPRAPFRGSTPAPRSARRRPGRAKNTTAIGDGNPRPLLSFAQPLLQNIAVQPEAVGGGGQIHMTDEADEVWEHNRFYGPVGWKAPLSVLDAPEWADAASGNSLVLQRCPAEDLEHWEPVVTSASDEHGWCYATVFKHLEYKRPGGRSSARFGDNVRRRLWRRRPDASAAEAPAVPMPLSAEGAAAAVAAAAAMAAAQGRSGSAAVTTAAAAAAAARAAREGEAKKKAVKQFMSMVLDLLSRRPAWTLVPWDPTAVFMLYKKHQQLYQELQAQAHERRLFTADQPAPPSQLREGRTLLQDLLCAAMHSRAAYGYPAAEGFMGSVANFVRLQTLQPLSFDAVGGVSAEANNESVAALAGLAVDDIVMAEWRNSVWRPCHYVAIDRANQVVVLSIRGSLQVGDLLSNLVAAPMEVEIGGADGWVHQGIFAAATFIHCNTQEALQEAAARYPGWPLLITGHSLGGGTAALLTLLLQQAGLPQGLGPVRCITVGTAAVMSQPLAAACNQLITSVIVGSDVVPHLSLASVEALLVEASQASPVRRTVEEWGNKLAGVLSTGSAVKAELSAVAAAATSTRRIAGNWAAVKEATVRLGRSASNAGLARILSATREQPTGQPAGRQGGTNGSQQGGQVARQIPVLVQQHMPQQAQWQQLLQQHGPQQIPVIDLSQPASQQEQQQATLAAPTAATPEQQQALHTQQQGGGQGQQEEDGHKEVLPYFCEFDSLLAEAGMAQEAVAEEQAAAAGAPASPVTTSTPSSGSPGNPELLFPPGRLIWIFPADEDVVALQTEAEQQPEGMNAAWLGANGGAGEQQQGTAVGGPAGSSRGQYEVTNTHSAVRGRGSVDMEEAAEAVELGAVSAPPPAEQLRWQAVAVDADRTSFERLLLMPDMLNDHLPDRYLSALQQL